jgi:hypothetical protein
VHLWNGENGIGFIGILLRFLLELNIFPSKFLCSLLARFPNLLRVEDLLSPYFLGHMSMLVVDPDYLADSEVFGFHPCLYPMKTLHPRRMYTLPRGGVQRGVTPSVGFGRTTIGYVFTIGGTTVSWILKLQKVVSLSTIEAEYVPAIEASKEMIWLQSFMEELGKK